MVNRPPKNKPVSLERAREIFNDDIKASVEAIYDYMQSKGYKWDREKEMYVDDGSLEAEWADGWNDEKKGN